MHSRDHRASGQLRTSLPRREFLHRTGQSALVAGAAACLPRLVAAEEAAATASAASQPESLVKLLFESLTPGQRERICLPWQHEDADRGLLRSRVEANWMITDPTVNSDFFKPEQRELVKAIYRGIIHPEWHERIDKQQKDDAGGFGEHNSIGIFGTPGDGKSELVITGRHMTIRCDGDSAEHVAFGGPIFYGHAAESFDETATHPGNVFWSQAVEANKLYEALDGKQQKLALVKTAPYEWEVDFRGKQGKFDGIPVAELSADQKARVQEVLRKLVEPYRQGDRDEVVECLKAQGGLDACSLAFYQEDDIGEDKVWDVWRLEGPSFVWHYRGAPHVHVWVNVASDPSVKTNAS